MRDDGNGALQVHCLACTYTRAHSDSFPPDSECIWIWNPFSHGERRSSSVRHRQMG